MLNFSVEEAQKSLAGHFSGGLGKTWLLGKDIKFRVSFLKFWLKLLKVWKNLRNCKFSRKNNHASIYCGYTLFSGTRRWNFQFFPENLEISINFSESFNFKWNLMGGQKETMIFCVLRKIFSTSRCFSRFCLFWRRKSKKIKKFHFPGLGSNSTFGWLIP